MPKVLMLARHFPPIGGAGVHRTMGSIRHLSRHGYAPVVVTGVASHRDRWEPRDEALLARVPDDVSIHRVQGTEPRGHSSRLERLLGAPPPSVAWWVDQSARLACEVGGDADVVYASCLPYETAFAGARVAAELGVPWVADLEDPWALDEMRLEPSAAHRALDLRRMRRALTGASAIVTAAPEAAARLSAAMPGLASRTEIVAIPIGYELADFPTRPTTRRDQVFRIVHAGSLHTDLGEHLRRTRLRRRLLGGTHPGLDLLTRSHVYLMRALARVIAREAWLEGRIELHLAGELTPDDVAAAKPYAFVRAPGLLSHAESVELMCSADLLFLPMQNLPPGQRAGLIPYKTYEYLAAGRPILAAVPDGDVRDMLAPLPHTSVVQPSDVEGMAAAVRRRIEAAAAAPGGREPDAAPPEAYTRARAVARIAQVLDRVVGAMPAAA